MGMMDRWGLLLDMRKGHLQSTEKERMDGWVGGWVDEQTSG